VDTPIVIDRVDRSHATNGDGVRLRLSGRRLRHGHPDEQEPLLIVQLHGRRHRFPAGREDPDMLLAPGAWEATFTLPTWAEPSQAGQAALWVGDAVVPVPLPGSTAGAAAPPGAPPHAGLPKPVPGPPAAAPGPPAGHPIQDSMAALHAELEQRSAEAARLRGSLAEAHSELDARRATQSALESAHRDLRGELQGLSGAIGAQREEFGRRLSDLERRLAAAEAERDRARSELESERVRASQQLAATASVKQQSTEELAGLREQLMTAQVSRDAAGSEVGALRTELERLGSELAVSREQLAAQGGDLGEAQRLLADARALAEQLRGQTPH
jgi:predicted  nucleic acid-binding Zn-ribbon protein